ncbi:hypothetical protein ACNQR7_31725 [Mycolicibacterium senegalense]|uniref:hypothetical protein n=1 Tax=Mycolicibacterium senegalense TaxID=1796 RepID=UPI003AACA634
MYDEPSAAEIQNAGERIAAAALDTARLIAAERLQELLGPAAADPVATVEAFLARDASSHPKYDVLRAFEQRWALLTIRLLEPTMNPAAAIRDARSRGVTVQQVAAALKIRPQTVYSRYGDDILLSRDG